MFIPGRSYSGNDHTVPFRSIRHTPVTVMLKYFHLPVTRAFGVVVTHRVRRFVMRRAAVRFPARPIPFTKIPTCDMLDQFDTSTQVASDRDKAKISTLNNCNKARIGDFWEYLHPIGQKTARAKFSKNKHKHAFFN